MTCTEFERLLDQREPDGQTKQEMQRHADTCGHCRLLLELRALDQDEKVPETASTQWKAAVRTEKAKTEAKRRSGFWNSRAMAPVLAAAAILVAVIALRQPIADLGGRQTVPLSTVSNEEVRPAGTEAPTPEAARTGMPAAAPKLMAVATASPLDFGPGSAPREEAPEEAAEADEMPMFALGAMRNESGADALISGADAEYEETAFMSACDSAAVEDEIGTQPFTLVWVSETPAEAANTLLQAIGQPEIDVDMEESGACLSLAVSRENVSAFLKALETAGCDPLPAETDLPWDEEGVCRLELMIEKGGTDR